MTIRKLSPWTVLLFLCINGQFLRDTKFHHKSLKCLFCVRIIRHLGFGLGLVLGLGYPSVHGICGPHAYETLGMEHSVRLVSPCQVYYSLTSESLCCFGKNSILIVQDLSATACSVLQVTQLNDGLLTEYLGLWHILYCSFCFRYMR